MVLRRYVLLNIPQPSQNVGSCVSKPLGGDVSRYVSPRRFLFESVANSPCSTVNHGIVSEFSSQRQRVLESMPRMIVVACDRWKILYVICPPAALSSTGPPDVLSTSPPHRGRGPHSNCRNKFDRAPAVTTHRRSCG